VRHHIKVSVTIAFDTYLPKTRLFVQLDMEYRTTFDNHMGLYMKVGRCRLTVSKPVMKAPTVSTLESTIGQTAFNVCFQIRFCDAT